MKVLITRPLTQSAVFGAALQQAGFEPVFFPVIEIRPLDDLSALDQALERIERYHWLIFTSVNAVDALFNRLPPADRFASNLIEKQAASGTPRVAAVGPKTAQALRARGIEPLFVPDEFIPEAILPGLGDLSGSWVLLPRAEIAREELPKAIAAAGAVAHEIAVYQTLPARVDPSGLEAIRAGLGWVTFTSPSTVRNFIDIIRKNGLDPFALPGHPKIACIGPITARAAEKEGFSGFLVAAEYTAEGLVELIGKSAR